jgi:DNA repair exonuclease SbcCD ATPase subunit
MVQIIKSSVKCYKKKAKKKVGGKQKIYEYSQYLVPLKRSDNLVCGDGVLLIPEQYFQELFGVDDTWSVKEYITQLKAYEMNIEEYTKEFRDLKWKHDELSRSYKELLNKHTKYTKKYKIENEKINEIEALNQKLNTKNKELTAKLESKELEYEKLKQNYEVESKKADILEDELKSDKDEDKDFWSVFKKRLGKKEVETKEDQ